MTIGIYKNGTLAYTLRSVISSSLSGNRDGELTFDFQYPLVSAAEFDVDESCTIKFGGLWYRITRINRSYADGLRTISISAEHEAMTLADSEIESFVYSGNVSGAMRRLLADTSFSLGTVANAGATVAISYPDPISRRAVLMQILYQCGDGYTLQFGDHTIGIQALSQTTVALPPMSVSETRDAVADKTCYELSYDAEILSYIAPPLAPKLNLAFDRLGVNVIKPVLSFSYNPFCCDAVTIEAGDYVPDIEEMYLRQQEAVSEAKKEAADVKKSLEDYAKKSDVSASVDTYINSEEGKASIVSSLSGTYVTTDDLTGYTLKTELSAEIGAYIDTEAGTAKIINRLEGTYVKESDLGDYVEKTELSTEIGSYIDTAAGTAKIVSAASGTYQKKSDMSGYVTKTNLDTTIGQYIDSTAGTAKIVSAASGTYQKKSDMSGYVTKTNLDTTIGQYIDSTTGTAKIISAVSGTYQKKSDMSGYLTSASISTIEQKVSSLESSITMSASYTSNTIGSNVYALLQLVSNANSSSIKIKADKIDFTGFTTFVKASDLGASGKTSIDGSRITTGKISADRLEVSSVKVDTVYGNGTLSNLKLLSSTSSTITLGGNYGFNYIEIYGGSNASCVRIGSGYSNCIQVDASSSKALYGSGFSLGSTANPWKNLYVGDSASLLWTINSSGIMPTSTTSTAYFNIGSSSKQVNAIYTKKLYVNGSTIGGGSTSTTTDTDFAGKNVKLGGNTSYYIYADTNRALRPSSSYSTYEFSLGTTDYYWHKAYIGSTAAYIGKSTTSKIGFFGKTPAAKTSLSTSSSLTQLLSALISYGLV